MSDPNDGVRKRQWALVAIGGVSVLALLGAGVWFFDDTSPPPAARPTTTSITPPGGIDDKDAWRGNEAVRASKNEQELKEQREKTLALERQIKEMAAAQEASKNRGEGAVGQIAMRSEQAAKNILNEPLPAPGLHGAKVLQPPVTQGLRLQPSPYPGQALNQVNQTPFLNQAAGQPLSQAPAPERIEMHILSKQSSVGGAVDHTNGGTVSTVLGFPVDESAKKWSKPGAPGGARGAVGVSAGGGGEFIPANSFVRAVMLNGIDAATGGQAQANPQPISLQPIDVANLANEHKLDIKDCRILVAAWGDLSSERTMTRAETLTCVIDGDTIEMPIRGQVMGTDGKNGIRGKLVSKQGALLANALFTGALSGIGDAFKSAATTTTTGVAGVTQRIDANRTGEVALAGGFASATNALAAYYLKAAERLHPVIETEPGQVVEVLITQGAIYAGRSGAQAPNRVVASRGGQGRAGDD